MRRLFRPAFDPFADRHEETPRCAWSHCSVHGVDEDWHGWAHCDGCGHRYATAGEVRREHRQAVPVPRSWWAWTPASQIRSCPLCRAPWFTPATWGGRSTLIDEGK